MFSLGSRNFTIWQHGEANVTMHFSGSWSISTHLLLHVTDALVERRKLELSIGVWSPHHSMLQAHCPWGCIYRQNTPRFQGDGTSVNGWFPSWLSHCWCYKDCDLLWLLQGCSFTFQTVLMSVPLMGNTTLSTSQPDSLFLLPSFDPCVTRGRRALLPCIHLLLSNCPILWHSLGICSATHSLLALYFQCNV